MRRNEKTFFLSNALFEYYLQSTKLACTLKAEIIAQRKYRKSHVMS